MSSRIFCAIDTPDIGEAEILAEQLHGYVAGLKLGMEFFFANGPEGVRRLRSRYDMPVFIDVKAHDIPNTVANSVAALVPLQPDFITVHAGGGPEMLRATAAVVEAAAARVGKSRPRLLGVTVLTSLDGEDLKAVGVAGGDPAEQVVRLAKLALASGMDGIVCAPTEIALLRREFGKEFVLMVPGIRPQSAELNDQKRVMTPAEAVAAGATYIVVGRPITQAQDPGAAARAINAEVAGKG